MNTNRVVKYWNSLDYETINSNNLNSFRAKIDNWFKEQDKFAMTQ